jgi:hypothetical protein
MRVAPKEPGDDSETGAVFSAKQWVYIVDIWEILL